MNVLILAAYGQIARIVEKRILSESRFDMEIIYKFIVCLIAGVGAGLGTGFVGVKNYMCSRY